MIHSTSSSGRGVSRTPSDPETQRVRQPVRLLLVDSLPIVHRGVASVLELRPDMTLVGNSSDHIEAARLAAELQPDMVVLDIVARGRRAGTLHVRLDLAHKIRRKVPRARCLIYTSFHPSQIVEMALAAHVAGVYSKLDSTHDLPSVIRFLHDNPHETHLSRTVQQTVRQRNHTHQKDVAVLSQITERETEILELVLQGKDSVSIAQALGISPRTVGTHRSRILHKTKARSFLELSGFLKRLATLGA